jgi:hypothetical protein
MNRRLFLMGTAAIIAAPAMPQLQLATTKVRPRFPIPPPDWCGGPSTEEEFDEFYRNVERANENRIG